MSILKMFALFFLFSVQTSLAQEKPLPAPFEAKLKGGAFCISEKLLLELFQENAEFGTIAREKEGCGFLFIPMNYSITPLSWTESKSIRMIIAKITNKFGEEAFVRMKPREQHTEYSFGMSIN